MFVARQIGPSGRIRLTQFGPGFCRWLNVHGPQLGHIVLGSTKIDGAARGQRVRVFRQYRPLGRRCFAMRWPRLGCCYALFAAWAARSFARRATEPAGDYPAVTLLKPLHGLEPGLYANLAGFCAQDYPSPVQIVFGVDDPADPAIGVVRKLIADFPDRDLTLAINARRHGDNRKVSNLINMARQARHEVLVVSDSDIVVGPIISHTSPPLWSSPASGLVTCLYRGIAAAGTVVAARRCGDRLSFPAQRAGRAQARPGRARASARRSRCAARRSPRSAASKRSPIRLADDYALGALVRRAGLTVAIPNYIVAHVCSERVRARSLPPRIALGADDPVRSIRAASPGWRSPTRCRSLCSACLLGGSMPAGLIVVAALACRFVLQSEIDRAFGLPASSSGLGRFAISCRSLFSS